MYTNKTFVLKKGLLDKYRKVLIFVNPYVFSELF
jgi:hypothetical protein